MGVLDSLTGKTLNTLTPEEIRPGSKNVMARAFDEVVLTKLKKNSPSRTVYGLGGDEFFTKNGSISRIPG